MHQHLLAVLIAPGASLNPVSSQHSEASDDREGTGIMVIHKEVKENERGWDPYSS